jgi:hypothetical protein
VNWKFDDLLGGLFSDRRDEVHAYLGIGDTTDTTVGSAVEFANPWHDERGRFAPKGTGRIVGDVNVEARALAPIIAEQGGLTYNPDARTLVTSGVPIGRPGHSEIIDDQIDPQRTSDEIAAYLTNLRDAGSERSGPFGEAELGIWHDKEHQEIVLDWVDVAPNRTEGVRLGRERGEQAVFDLDTGDLIPTGGTGGRETIEKVTATIDTPTEFANPWHDEAGKFAPKGAAGRIAPLEGGKKVHVALDLALEDLPPEIQTASIAQMENGLGVTRAQAEENMVALAEDRLAASGGDLEAAGALWYDGAHDRAIAAGDPLDPDVSVAVTAALSPGCEWSRNEQYAKDVFDAARHRDDPVNVSAADDANRWRAIQTLTKEGRARGTAEADAQGITDAKERRRVINRTAKEWAADPDRQQAAIAADTGRIKPGDTLATVFARDPDTAGVYVARINPSGVRTYDNHIKAVDLAMHNDPARISDTLAGAKVRSFYDNIRDPRAYEPAAHPDVTIDAHMMRSMVAGDSPGGYDRLRSVDAHTSALTSTPSYSGAHVGAYPAMADSVRTATATFNAVHPELPDLLPHQFQAMVWSEQIDRFPLGTVRTILNGTEVN